jgi:hypothetical protein
MKYIDIDTLFAERTWCLPSLWLGLRESLCFTLYILHLTFIALHSYLPKLSITSLVILACIWLIILIIMLG